MTVDDPWTGVSALVDPSRRALYDYVRRAGHPVSREEAGDATGTSRGLAAFHLDKLVDAGLLQARYQAPPGPLRGRGRTPKVYEPVGEGVTVTIPERRYQLIAEILAAAVDDDPGHADRAAGRHAHERGRAIGAALAADGADLTTALTDLGFEPHPTTDRVLLRNCPFHGLAARHTALVCGLNHAFLAGLLHGLGATDRHAALAPRPGHCCVELASAPSGIHPGP
ncbi:helix-turn-helix transcriptional regulator [Micromonospora olivasterospora]|uniref:Putative ArsR family transcriptional regulator n=1 Tax=Micromonospora olivasterospora TaxID=1880 RepID=A0A562II30_MICOL|nr:helix-turn-helix domain-containing protein [Micromonospora olivasterospora]TWH70552.1 putative ArsR family transcriptional regulator [Micromonospora olivasterospora]